MDYAERIAEVYGMTPAEAEQIERELAEWEDGKSQADYATTENPYTNPSLSPKQRAHQAANEPDLSCDWNPETEEFNPYPLGSADFRQYEREFDRLIDYGRSMGYDV